MLVVWLIAILFRCIVLIELINSETLRNAVSNLDNEEYNDFLQLYRIIKQHQRFKNQPQEITNNIYFIPMPFFLPQITYETSQDEEKTRKISSFDGKFDAAFRDPEATLVDKTSSAQPQIIRKFMGNSVRIPFEPSKHKNWNLMPNICGHSSANDRITGGDSASLGQYPWMARIGFLNANKKKSKPVFRCAGSLITKNHVITAAHCVTDLPSELSVGIIRLGEYNTDTYIDCVENQCADKIVDVKPNSITVHENYGKPNARNDIAIILLEKSIKFTVWISPICLPFGELMNKDFTYQKGEVAGWGFYDISINKGSTTLKTVQLPILKSQPCAKVFRGVQINYKKQLCVGGDLGKDSCNGDSGGPLMKVVAIKKEPKYVLLGIVSLGARYCGLTAAPAIYTKITYYMEWILDHLK